MGFDHYEFDPEEAKVEEEAVDFAEISDSLEIKQREVIGVIAKLFRGESSRHVINATVGVLS